MAMDRPEILPIWRKVLGNPNARVVAGLKFPKVLLSLKTASVTGRSTAKRSLSETDTVPRKANLLARDIFPGWMSTGPWPYEVGMVGLMSWVVWCMLHGGVLRLMPGYTPTPFTTYVSASPSIHGVLLAAALVLVVGKVAGLATLLAGERQWGNKVRGASILGAAVFTGGMAALFLSAVEYSLAGGAYAFIAWRAFCVGVRLWWEPVGHAQSSG